MPEGGHIEVGTIVPLTGISATTGVAVVPIGPRPVADGLTDIDTLLAGVNARAGRPEMAGTCRTSVASRPKSVI